MLAGLADGRICRVNQATLELNDVVDSRAIRNGSVGTPHESTAGHDRCDSRKEARGPG